MPTPLAAAFIRLRPDTAEFRKEAERDLGRAGKEAGEEFAEEFEDALDDVDTEGAGEEAGTRFGGAFATSVKEHAGAAMAAVGAAAAAALGAGFAAALDVGAARSKLQAQLGLTQTESKRIGDVAGKLFSQAYGESMEDVNGAVTSVIRNIDGMRGASSSALETMAARAITTGQVLDEDVGNVTRAVSQLMRTGLAKNSEQAFDLITKGAQSGANASGDLLDTITEYGTQFREVGISGPKAFGLMSQAVKAGARDLDTVADAIKEFAIRSKDGSDTSAAGFKALGLNSDKMFQTFAKGGPNADKAFLTVTKHLRAMKDPVEQDATAVALFGTKAEDLQDALYALDPAKAVAEFGKLKGATDKAGDAFRDNAKTKIETFRRSLETSVVHVIADDVIPAMERLGKSFTDAGGTGTGLVTAVGAILAVGVAAKVGSLAVGAVKAGISGVATAGRGVAAAAGGIGRFASGFRSADAAASAFSGRMGTVGGKARSAFNAVGTGAKAAASATRGAAVAVASGAGRLASGFRSADAAQSAFSGRLGTLGGKARNAFNAAGAGARSAALATRGAAVAASSAALAWSRNAAATAASTARTVAAAAVQRSVALATRAWALSQAALNVVMSANPIALVVIGIAALVAAVVIAYKKSDTFKRIVDAAFRGIAQAGKWMWDVVLKPVFGFLGKVLAASGLSFKIYLGIAKSVWSGISGAVGAGWGKISGFFGRIKTGMGLVGKAFGSGATAIRSAWNRVQEYTKKPINFVIGTVYNKGIVGMWNQVMSWLHLPGSLKLNTLPLLASGGPLPVRPGIFNKPTAIVGEGNPSYPEYVIPTDPKYRSRAQALWNSAGSNLQMLENGGILGSIKAFAGKAVGLGKNALDLITNPGKIWERLVGGLPSADGLRTSPFGIAAAEMPKLILKHAKEYALKFVNAFGSGYGGDGQGVVNAALKYIGTGDDKGVDNNNMFTRHYGWPSGTPWCALFVSKAIEDAKAGKRYPGYPTAAVAGYQGAMKHVGIGEGRPGDLATYGSNDHINMIVKKVAGGYDTVGGNQGPLVNRYVRSSQRSILRPLAAGGTVSPLKLSDGALRAVFAQRQDDPADSRNPMLRTLRQRQQPLFDKGGFGVGWPFHASKPEAVFTDQQWGAIHKLASAGARPSVTVNMHGIQGIPTEKQLTSAVERATTMQGRW